MRRATGLIVALALVVALAAPAAAVAPPQPAEPAVTLYAFFATWCVPCRVELPHIEALHRELGARGLRVILVSEDAPSTAANIAPFLARYSVTAPWILDRNSALLKRYNPTGALPFTVLIDPIGEQIFARAGYEPGDEKALRAAIVAALAPAVSGSEASEPPALRWQIHNQGLGVWRRSRFAPVADNDGLLRAAALRTEVTAASPGQRASARIDGALVDDEIDGRDGEIRAERLSLEWSEERFSAVGGDSYAQFGEGVALSLRRVDSLGVDTALRGGQIEFPAGPVGVHLLAGVTNPQNLDPIELRLVDEDPDRIAGAELELPIGERAELAPYGLVAEAPGASPTGGEVRWSVGGGALRWAGDELRLVADVAGGRRAGYAFRHETSYAGYASATWIRGRTSLLVEGKLYRHWLFGRAEDGLLYHEPPTLEREDQQVPGNEDAIGSRARVEVRLGHGITTYANALGYRFSQDDSSPVGGKLALHGYAGAEKRFASGASTSLQSGHRREEDDDGDPTLRLWHLDFDVSVPVAPGVAFTSKWNHVEEEKLGTFDPLPFRRGLAVVGVSLIGVGTASALYGYSTESASNPTHYPGGELLVHAPRGGYVRLFAGRLTGGRICVSGTCRDVPPFEGARIDLILRN